MLYPYDLTNPQNTIDYNLLVNIKREITQDYYIVMFIKDTGPVLISEPLQHSFLECVYFSQLIYEKEYHLTKWNKLKYSIRSCLNGLFSIYIERKYIWEPFQNYCVIVIISENLQNLYLYMETHLKSILQLPDKVIPNFDLNDPEERVEFYLYQMSSYLVDSKMNRNCEYENINTIFHTLLNIRTDKSYKNLQNALLLIGNKITNTNGRVFTFLNEFMKYIHWRFSTI